MSTTARPNSEAIYRAINIYIDAMRPFILRCLAQAYESGRVSDAVINSLSEQQAENFEIALQRNDGDIAATLDVNHFRPIVERHWDAIFAERFGYDQTIPGTLSWITRARNDVAHPGTSDMSNIDAQGHFSNILKILRRVNAIDASTAIEQIRRQSRNPPPRTMPNTSTQPAVATEQIRRQSRNPSPRTSPNTSTQPAMAKSSSANIRGQNINQYQRKDLGLDADIDAFIGCIAWLLAKLVGLVWALTVAGYVLYGLGTGDFFLSEPRAWAADRICSFGAALDHLPLVGPWIDCS